MIWLWLYLIGVALCLLSMPSIHAWWKLQHDDGKRSWWLTSADGTPLPEDLYYHTNDIPQPMVLLIAFAMWPLYLVIQIGRYTFPVIWKILGTPGRLFAFKWPDAFRKD